MHLLWPWKYIPSSTLSQHCHGYVEATWLQIYWAQNGLEPNWLQIGWAEHGRTHLEAKWLRCRQTIAMAVSARSYCYGCGNENGRYTHLQIHVYMSWAQAQWQIHASTDPCKYVACYGCIWLYDHHMQCCHQCLRERWWVSITQITTPTRRPTATGSRTSPRWASWHGAASGHVWLHS